MTRDEAIKLFEKQLAAAQAVLDSGFGSNQGENSILYRRRKEMAEIAISALRPVSREQVDVVIKSLKLRLENNEEGGVVYIPKFAVEGMIERLEAIKNG